jgi:hypothetical protein
MHLSIPRVWCGVSNLCVTAILRNLKRMRRESPIATHSYLVCFVVIITLCLVDFEGTLAHLSPL